MKPSKLFIICIMLCSISTLADPTLPNLFGDHMVLQRGKPIRVWGRAKAGEAIAVKLAGVSVETKAKAAGTWTVTLPAQKAGGPYELIAKGDSTVALKDVLIGDVWVASGQSNMVYGLKGSFDGPEAIKKADLPQIRFLTVGYSSTYRPATDIQGTWQVCTPETAGGFSAVAFYFARRLQKELKVPIGIQVAAVGATSISSWNRLEGLQSTPSLKREADAWKKREKEFPEAVDDTGWEQPELDLKSWGTMAIPAEWEKAEESMKKLNGVVWFRRQVTISRNWAGQDLLLKMGPIDDYEDCFWNGVKIATGEVIPLAWKTPRTYTVPGRLVKAGEVALVLKVYDRFGGGGLLGKPEDWTLGPAGTAEPIVLAGDWRYRTSAWFADNTLPTGLYNGKVAPLTQMPVKGVLWYQGESNAGHPGYYSKALPTLIASWRDAWGNKELPFYVVQLPNIGKPQTVPIEPKGWPVFRAAQATALELPATGLAITYDGKDPRIHPRDKEPVGHRLAQLALAKAYGRGIPATGPVFAKLEIRNSKAVIHFNSIGGGLTTRDGKSLKGFAIAGRKGDYVWANARIVGKTVVLFSRQIDDPARVAYAWAGNPIGNLVNVDGLPAPPFRANRNNP